jgi:hypothetical protein
MPPTIKPFWTDADFDAMSFHDVHIRAFGAEPDTYELLLDLDYLFQWVPPAEGETYFRFWVAPVTLAFENAHDVRIDVRSSQGDLEIATLRREEATPTPNDAMLERRYVLECREGDLSVVATGFTMYVRRPPVLVGQQSLTLEQRGGVSFGRTLVET